jgi:hypothetical protein
MLWEIAQTFVGNLYRNLFLKRGMVFPFFCLGAERVMPPDAPEWPKYGGWESRGLSESQSMATDSPEQARRKTLHFPGSQSLGYFSAYP